MRIIAKFTPVSAGHVLVTAVLLLACLSGCATPAAEQRDQFDATFLVASQALDNGDIETAHGLLSPLLTPDNHRIVDTMHLLARIYAIAGDTRRQREMTAKILEISPADPQALEMLGLLVLAEGHAAAAGEYLLRATQVDALRWAAWNGLGIIADEQKRHAEAAEYFLRGLDIVPGHPKLLANLGWSKVLVGEMEAGELLLRQSIKTAPDSLVTRSNLAFCIALQGRYEEARSLYAQMYDASIAANNIGYAALVRGDRKRASVYLREALTLKPSFYEKASNNLDIAFQP